jgi:general secretion pathway protein G
MKNNNFKKAFTMIELIFVIVILGVLSAVAIPKLMATKDDANMVKEISNAKQIMQNASAEYISQGSFST